MLQYTYLYENIMFTNQMRLFGKGKAWEPGEERKVLALIKSLIYAREERGARGMLWKVNQNRSNLYADTIDPKVAWFEGSQFLKDTLIPGISRFGYSLLEIRRLLYLGHFVVLKSNVDFWP